MKDKKFKKKFDPLKEFKEQFESLDFESKINLMYEIIDTQWDSNDAYNRTQEGSDKLLWIMNSHSDVFMEAKERTRPR